MSKMICKCEEVKENFSGNEFSFENLILHGAKIKLVAQNDLPPKDYVAEMQGIVLNGHRFKVFVLEWGD